jgi:LDH2 family malate/lactate/ureidoglycolate dehydrogenase
VPGRRRLEARRQAANTGLAVSEALLNEIEAMGRMTA